MRLSITIPTLNRSKLLSFTLQHFAVQIENVTNDVELIVCNNASDDDTVPKVEELRKQYPFIQLHDCKERVALGDNFKRAVSFTHGDYIILWGDDDIPAPFLINYLINLIKNNRCGLYYFNRLVGYENGNGLKSLSVYGNEYNERQYIYNNSTSFISDHFWGATFMSAMMFSKEVWEKGLRFNTSSHYGFEFMGILYYGNSGSNIIYDNYPLCIQRKVAKREWGTDWPKYALLGLPNMSRDLEKEGLFDNGFKVWQKKYNKFILFCYILLSASTNKKKYKPMCKEMASNQSGLIRKGLVYFIIYCMPGFLYKISRYILFYFK